MDPMTRSAVAEITVAGQITEIDSGVNPTGLEDGDSILAGDNGALWFTDSGSPNAIGRIVIPPIATTSTCVRGFDHGGHGRRVGDAVCRHHGSFDPIRDQPVARLLDRGWFTSGGHGQFRR